MVLVGCNKHTPDLTNVPVATIGAVPERIEYSDWSLTLSRVVKGNEVDLEKLSVDPGPLNAFLAQAAAIGRRRTPALFPDDTTRLALLVNLQNAAALSGMLNEYRRNPKKYHESRVGTPPPVHHDGRAWSTAELRAEIRRLSHDDWRIPFALFDGRRDGPPLWPKPILPNGFDAQLSRIALSTLKQPNIVFIDHAEQKLWLWPVLYDLRGRLIDQYEQRYHTTDATVLSALLDLSDADRRSELNTAIGYSVVRMTANAAPAVVKPPELE